MNKMDIKNMQAEEINQAVYKQIEKNWDNIAKPLDGLGRFEKLIARIGAIHGTTEIDIEKKAVIVMCADNGIVEEGVSQSGQETTTLIARCLGKGQTSVGKMAAFVGADVIPVDVGVSSDEAFPGVQNRKITHGTGNFAKSPSMTEEQALEAIQIGIEMVAQCKKEGYRLLATGEVGIGNTTTSAAMAAALTGCKVSEAAGRGAGLDDRGLERKRQVIQDALHHYELKKEEPLRILCTVGGLDIAGLTGVFLGGMLCHIPIVADGVISLVAALTAERLVPGTKAYMIASHRSKEPAAEILTKELGLSPVIDAGLALGEGTGAVMMLSLLDIARTLYQSETTFQTMELAPYERFSETEESR